jgi:hypothetical protein
MRMASAACTDVGSGFLETFEYTSTDTAVTATTGKIQIRARRFINLSSYGFLNDFDPYFSEEVVGRLATDQSQNKIVLQVHYSTIDFNRDAVLADFTQS